MDEMDIESRIALFAALGRRIGTLSQKEFLTLAQKAYHENNWFTETNIRDAFRGMVKLLNGEKLQQWTEAYRLQLKNAKNVGIVMAGNIPLVGFHDLLSVIISGHKAAVKPSSNDKVLTEWIVKELHELEPGIEEIIRFEERLNHVDAMIATGSNNSARYFEYYFSRMPHIIRKNRTSCALLTGEETGQEIESLGFDMLSYFGLGCRNVSKLFVPKGYDLTGLLHHLSPWEKLIEHHKYKNNYDYNKSVYLINREPHLDTGFLLLKEQKELVSPISVVFYEYYDGEQQLVSLISENQEKIQCIVGNMDLASVAFGDAQFPEPWDYADGVDTLKFLSSLG